MAVGAVVQLVQALLPEVLTVWTDQSMLMPPKAFSLRTLTLLCSRLLVIPITIFLVILKHLLLKDSFRVSTPADQQQFQGSEAEQSYGLMAEQC